jgi:parallel beta-helix repeat protein
MRQRIKPLVAFIATFAFILAASRAAVATEVSGDQSGTWGLSRSPYELIDDVHVPPGSSLLIEPGVEVIGLGNYKISVDAGATLTAVGTESQMILFTAADQDTGWRGIRLEGASDDSEINYCILEYAKGTGAYPLVRGGALMVIECSPMIANSVFRYNFSANDSRNGAGGGLCTENSSATIADNYFHDNQADSGGALCITEYGSPIVRNNLLTDNRAFSGGGGMYFGARSSPIIENNVILRNHSAGWGGGGINCWNSFIYYGTYPIIYNNIIAYNTTIAAGGGMYCRYDHAIITNNLIVNNEAYRGGGIHAINAVYSAPIVANCIIRGNIASLNRQVDLETSTGSQIYVTYSDVENGYTGAGNIDAEPLYVDPDGEDDILGTDDDNYRFAAGSPGIDAGDNYALHSQVTLDFDGNPRYVDDPDTPDTGRGTRPIIDMGPYEFPRLPLILFGPTPGFAGQVNTLRTEGSVPGEPVYFVYGFTSGQTAVPGCSGLAVDIDQPQLIGSGTADDQGFTELQVYVPGAASGLEVVVQAVESESCRASNQVEHLFP